QHAFNVFKQLKRQTTNDLSDINSKLEKPGDNFDSPIRILIKDADLYKFCKERSKRISFILEK
uniref:plasmid partition family protein n=1 Tax=Borreliella bavariensis TaxID=664662 RepID=UPI001CB72D5E